MPKQEFAIGQDGQAFDDVQALVQRHLLIVGQTGSGKTTTTLALLHRLQELNHTAIVLDPTGEYRHLSHAVRYQLGINAYLDPGHLTVDQLCQALSLKLGPVLREKLHSAINALRIQQNLVQTAQPYVKLGVPIRDYQRQLEQLGDWARSYQPRLLARQLVEEFIIPCTDEKVDYSLLGQDYARQQISQCWDTLTTIRERMVSREFRILFDPDPQRGQVKTDLFFALKMFVSQHTSRRTLVIDLSALRRFGPAQRVVISLLMKQLLADQIQQVRPRPVTAVIDEAHRYLPTDLHDLSTNGIFQVLREGRKVRLSLTLTTQSSLDLSARLRSQFTNLLIHQLTTPEELAALSQTSNWDRTRAARLDPGEALLWCQHRLKVIRVQQAQRC